jgi:creatinine amidohydrolase
MDSSLRTGPVCWEKLTWCEIEALVDGQPSEVALLPVGATEQHGPHLPTGTDTIIATELSRAVSQRTGAVVLPALAIGCSFGHGTALPGTLSATPERLADLVRDTVEWAGTSGFSRVLAVNGHFGNQASLAVAGDHIRREHPELRFGVLNWWTLTPEVTAETLADGEDIHANRAETALMMALAPDMVRVDQVPFADDPDRTAGLVFRYTAPNLSLNGVTGSPSLATPELGQRLLDMVLPIMCDSVVRGRTEEPPLVGRRERVRAT